jgi:alkaline phosphatase D
MLWLSAMAVLPPWKWGSLSFAQSRAATAIILGPAFGDSAVLTVSHSLGEGVFVRVSPAQGVKVTQLEKQRTPQSKNRHIRVEVSGLSPQREYRLEVLQGRKVIDVRKFSTLNPAKDKLRTVVAACMDDFYVDLQRDMWGQVAGLKPDALFLIGDNVYADRRNGEAMQVLPDVDTIFERYEETRFTLDLFRQERLIPVISVWDDHDLGRDNSHRETPAVTEIQGIFRLFFPDSEQGSAYVRGPGLSARMAVGPYRFHVLDDRTFRVPKSQGEENHVSAHWGEAQEKWLMEGLREKGKLLHFIVNGDQLFGGYVSRFESYEADHPKAFQMSLAGIRESGARVVFVSGDRHFFEVQEIEPELLGYRTYELTSSAIHAKVFPSFWGEFPNPRQKFAIANTANFLTIEVRGSQKSWDLSVQGRGPKNQAFYSQLLQIARP